MKMHILHETSEYMSKMCGFINKNAMAWNKRWASSYSAYVQNEL